MPENNKKLVTSEDFTDVSILLVDDELNMLESMRALLTHYGYRIDTALGGAAAIEKLSVAHYDLLLLDLRMPGVDGHQVMEFVNEQALDILTIVISGETSYAEMSRALRNGGYDYLKKPYAPEELLATLNNAIRKCRLEKAHHAMQDRVRKSEQMYRFIVNNSADIIFMLDEKGCFSFLNSKIDKLLGLNKEELIGKPLLSLVEAEDQTRASRFFTNLDLESDHVRNIELVLRSHTSMRNKRHFELSVWPVEGDDNAIPMSFGREQRRFRIYGTARDITERKEAEAFINFQAYHDLLTRLPNRALFKDRLGISMAQCRRTQRKLAVMFLDLDRFKIVNDSLGHTVGDRLLQAVSLRLQKCLRRGDTLSRFGGDEFTLLLPEIATEDAAAKIAQKLIRALKQPFFLGEHEIYVGCSIGIVVYPGGGEDIDSLIQNADIAMYQVKDRGKDGFAFYSTDMNAATANRLHFERDVRRALEHNEFRVHFQPQIDARNGEMVGVEALIRWQHPNRGFILPGEFIPIAEETRLIMEIDKWILKSAAREVRSWYDQGYPQIRLAVNFSPVFFEQVDFVDQLLAILDECNFPRDHFEIEITENVILSDLDHIVEKLARLNRVGITIAIDDFGTGYSSLSYLQKFPINTLKIDQTFVQNIKGGIDEACIVNAIVSMAQGLKLNIVAEGVETKCQLNYLRDLGCHHMQGHYFGRAMSGADITRNYPQVPLLRTAEQ